MNRKMFERLITYRRVPGFKVLMRGDVTDSDIRDAVYLDSLVYPKPFRGNFETCIEWYNKNPFIYFMIKDENSNCVVAYANVMVVTKECYKKIKRGEILDVEISPHDLVQYGDTNSHFSYFSSIVVHPEYRNTCVFRILIRCILKYFVELAWDGIQIEKMIVDAVTGEGRRLCKFFGMNKIRKSKHSSNIYEICFPFL